MSQAFPFVGGTSDVPYSEKLPMFTEYDWDFELDRFKTDDTGKRIHLTGDNALKVWVYKALKTERNQYLAYSTRYGIELKPFIGKVMSVGEQFSELKRVIIECLMVNPYIKAINSVEFSQSGDKVDCAISLTTIYGGININV